MIQILAKETASPALRRPTEKRVRSDRLGSIQPPEAEKHPPRSKEMRLRDGPRRGPAQLDETGWGTDWSPDGTQIAYTSGYNTLMIFDLVEGTTVNLFDGRGPYNQIVWNFAWSPDGKKIAFRATLQNGKQGIVAVDTRGAKHGLDVLHEGTALPAVCWTTDSKQILFSEAVAERGNIRAIFGISATPGSKPDLMKGLPEDRQLMDPSISADGKKIAFSAYKRMPKAEK